MAKNPPAPPISDELLEWLEQVFPDRLPKGVVDRGELGARIGEQRVIRKLRSEHERSREASLEVTYV